MNQEVKDKWISALESGEFEQGARYLHTSDEKYCCLGVLCELAYREGVIDRRVKVDGSRFIYGAPGTGSDVALPVAVQQWAGLEDNVSSLPRIPYSAPVGQVRVEPRSFEKDTIGLHTLNDALGMSFHEIALLIKEHL